MEGEEEKRPYKIKDVTRQIKKSVVASTFQELLKRSSEKFDKSEVPRIHLDSDGTEIDDEDYFQWVFALEPNTELIAIFCGEQWIDPAQQFVTITSDNGDTIDNGGGDERLHLKKIASQIKSNVVISDSDLEALANMEMDNFADLIGEDFVEQLKEIKENSGRILCEKRDAFENYELLKLMRNAKLSNSDKATWSFCPSESESTTSLSTMSSFSSNIQQ